MTTYIIENTTSGHILGDYAADSPDAAWLACCLDAGYPEPCGEDISIYELPKGMIYSWAEGRLVADGLGPKTIAISDYDTGDEIERREIDAGAWVGYLDESDYGTGAIEGEHFGLDVAIVYAEVV